MSFIKLSRALLTWDWHDEPKTGWLYIVMLLLANHEETLWRGEKLLRGQLLSGRRQLSIASGLTEDEVRTALAHLKKTGDVVVETRSKYSIITLPKYDEHCSFTQQIPSDSPNESPAYSPAESPAISPAKSPTNPQQAPSKAPADPHIQELKELKEPKKENRACAREDDDLVFAAVQFSQSMDALEDQWRKMGNAAAHTDLEAMEGLLADYEVQDILDAMKAAADNGVKHSWPYIRKVLANWRANGRGVRANSKTDDDPYAGVMIV